jgi:Xaa-Pro aminopeptidase
MKFFRLLAVCVLASACASAATAITHQEYKQRRAALREALGDAVTILFGNSESEHGDLRSGFFQESNFYYLTGWTQPGAILVITPDSEALLIPKRNREQEKWTGLKAAPEDKDIREVTGFETVLAAESFEANLLKWSQAAARIYTVPGQARAGSLRTLLPTRDVGSAVMPIAKLRMVKSPAEIELIQKSTDAAIEAHRAAWKRIEPGVAEYQVAAAMGSVYFEKGCERHAYAPIVGSGPNAATLHYSKNSRTIDRGDLVLMDVGPECSMYATDITRTVPATGKFTPRQREIYDIVLGAQKAAIDAIKPGVMLGSRSNKIGLHKLVMDYIDSHGKDRKGKPLGAYFTHGLGHHVGLDVHDPYDPSLPLQPGMVITIEPGIYIPEEGIGVRIEDVILVTEDGAKVLSSTLARDAGEIEKAMSAD